MGAAVACGLGTSGTGQNVGPATSEAGTVDATEAQASDVDGSSFADAGSLDAADGAAVDGGACPSTGRGPDMVRIFGECIDVTEVTNAQYDEFVTSIADGGPPSKLPAVCGAIKKGDAGAKSFARDAGASAGPFEPTNWVDYCDAYTFCAWAGKRLCKSGSDAGSWAAVCSSNGLHAFSYGDEPDADACDSFPNPLWEAGSFPACRVGATGPFDMNGSLSEWSLCGAMPDGGPLCHVLGGSVLTAADNDRCDLSVVSDAAVRTGSVGFRCCAD
jgi:hypothetical protein